MGKFKGHNPFITLLVVILTTIGTILIYSATFNASSPALGQNLFIKQIFLIIVGFIAYFTITLFDYHWLKAPPIIISIYAVTLGLLLYVKLFAPEVAGTSRWISIGPVNIQPAEYAKLTVIIVTAGLFSRERAHLGKYDMHILAKATTSKLSPFLQTFITSLLSIIPISVLILIQPSLGNTLITLFIWLILILIKYPDKKHLLTLFLFFCFALLTGKLITQNPSTQSFVLIIIFLTFIYFLYSRVRPPIIETVVIILLGLVTIPTSTYTWNNLLKDYQRERIETFIDPTRDPQGSGWQIRQAQIAIGSGRIFGRGFLQGTQTSSKLLPYPYTDFIFASAGEQFGLVGLAILTILLLALPLTIFWLADGTNDEFAKLILYGIAIMLLLHIFVNTGMNLGKLPVTGIPLPLISYGGSSIVVNMIGLGIVQNILKFKSNSQNQP